MKTMQVSTLLQNLQLEHKMLHKLRHQQPLNLLEFQLRLLVHDKKRLIHNHTSIRLHIVILPFIFQLIQMKWYKMKLKI